MCTVIIDRRPEDSWPVVIAANRDERGSRPWRAPARHWDDRPEVVGGFDDAAGGSWMGINDDGVVAILLNRRGTLGPQAGKRSRGELVLEALDHADAAAAAAALVHLNAGAYRPFNLVLADNRDAIWLANRGRGRVEAIPIPDGVSLIAADDLNDPRGPRDRFRPAFAAAPRPDPAGGDWSAWQALLTRRDPDPVDGPRGGLCVVTDGDYGTVSSSLVALPAAVSAQVRPIWLFAAGRPGEAAYRPIDLDPVTGGRLH